METLIDLWILVFIPLMVYRGYRRGGVMTVCSFCSIFVAFSVATLLSNNFCDQVGRLLQPAIKQSITSVLEARLGNEDILIEKSYEVSMNTDWMQNTGGEVEDKNEYLSLSRALQLLDGATDLKQVQGFVEYAKSVLTYHQEEYVGSVTDMISTVMGREIARVGIFCVAFILGMSMWMLFSRGLAKLFKFPGLAEINGIMGAGLGLFLALLLIYVFAWATGGGIIAWSGVERTVLYEFFVKTNPLGGLASASSIHLDF